MKEQASSSTSSAEERNTGFEPPLGAEAGCEPESGAGGCEEGSEGCQALRTWDVFAVEDPVEGNVNKECAPWIRFQLGNGPVDALALKNEVQKKCPFRVQGLDALSPCEDGPPGWVSLSFDTGLKVAPERVLFMRIKPPDVDSFSKFALLYFVGPYEDVDVGTRVPDEILEVPRSQHPGTILEELQAWEPHCHFEYYVQGDKGEQQGWQELTHTSQQAVPAGVMRIKVVRPEQGRDVVLPEGHVHGADTIKKRSAGAEYPLSRSLFSGFKFW